MKLTDENRLSVVNPILASEWNYKRNGDLTPDMVSVGSSLSPWWICNKGHEWQAKVIERSKGNGCPYCSGHRVMQGFNDLATTNPALAAEWNYEKNGDLLPTMVMAGSNKKAWWKCKFEHEWQATIGSRNSGNGCPYCAKELGTSFPEQAIYYYISRVFPDAENRNKSVLGGKEIDIWIPSIKTAIEYNGSAFHSGEKQIERDNLKAKLCRGKDIRLIYILEPDAPAVEDCINIFREEQKTDGSLEKCIRSLLEMLNIKSDINVNIDRDRIEILSSYISMKKSKSLASTNPDLAAEWNYEKNGKLTPDMVMAGSDKRAWWLCKKEGHEWQESIANRNNGNGCPYCSGRRVLRGFNDLATTNPDLAAEWNYERNGDLLPSMVTAKSKQKVWWICKKSGHEWKAVIADRAHGHGCPFCSNQKVLAGYNDLATTDPELAAEWDYEKNGTLTPAMVTRGSGKRAWWKCKFSHGWQASIVNRSKGTGCPYCDGKKVLQGFNDLATTNPALAAEWDYEKNGDLTPTMVTAGCNKKVWWKCKNGHSWQATVNSRNRGNGCPYCAGRKNHA